MEKRQIRKILKEVKDGKISTDRALEALRAFPFDDMGFAKIDTHRDLRKGFPEVVFCSGKSCEQITAIFGKRKDSTIMATRADHDIYQAVKKTRKEAVYYPEAAIVFAGRKRRKSGRTILVASAGTSDIPVAEEAAVTAEILGNRVDRSYDIGVAGMHRMLANREKLARANVVIVVAGMDGALPSLVGGLVGRPVIAVPTSVGYGANFRGLAPLLTVLNSCAPGVATVNIDNGFGAGYMASLINRK
ncbi:MAG: nickel pincer cofactor biosynthesis protein LarB [Candidatus Omnitrophica bacterium]|nr:nickel pincer cofactor biosynthesis protein LarB [Candidatus Omnitrophota bacterium]